MGLEVRVLHVSKPRGQGYKCECVCVRYAVSVMWELDPDFRVVNVWYGPTVIHSAYKLFYEVNIS